MNAAAKKWSHWLKWFGERITGPESDVVGSDRGLAVEGQARRGENGSGYVVDRGRLVRPGALVKAIEVLRGARVGVDLGLELGHSCKQEQLSGGAGSDCVLPPLGPRLRPRRPQ